jgi:hypothetical protein
MREKIQFCVASHPKLRYQNIEILVMETAMKNLVGLCVAVAFAASSTIATAASAQLTAAEGKVLINSGTGFVAAAGLTALNTGDRVFVGDTGMAVVSYSNGCAVSVASGSVVTITEKAPCAAGSTIVAGSVITPVADAYAAPANAGWAGLGAAGLLPLFFIGGAAAIVGGALILSDDNNSGATS